MKPLVHLLIHELREEEHLGVKAISSRLGIPRTTVARHLRQPRLPEARSSAGKSGKLSGFEGQILRLCADGLSAVQICRSLAENGYDGGETLVRDFIRRSGLRNKEAFLELAFAPGEAAQVDFAECGLVRTGNERHKLHAFVMVLCNCRRIFVRFIMRENTEHFLACHREAFERFGAVPRKVIVDNCKVAVVHTPDMYGAAVINPRYADMAAHYGFAPVACHVRAPYEKGIVERAVGYLRTSFLNGLDTASMTLEALNAAVDDWCAGVADCRKLKDGRGTPESLFPGEKAAMLPLADAPYDCGVVSVVRISRQCRVHFETNRYSVPMAYAGRMAQLSALPSTIRIFLDGKLVAEHRRCYERQQAIVLAAHDLELVAKRKRAAKGKAREMFLTLAECAPRYLHGLEERRPDWFLHVSRILALLSEYGEDAVADALEDAVSMEAYGAEYIANLLAARRKLAPALSPLQLTHHRDVLDMDVEKTDLAQYDL